jgi:hypothetical protein
MTVYTDLIEVSEQLHKATEKRNKLFRDLEDELFDRGIASLGPVKLSDGRGLKWSGRRFFVEQGSQQHELLHCSRKTRLLTCDALKVLLKDVLDHST